MGTIHIRNFPRNLYRRPQSAVEFCMRKSLDEVNLEFFSFQI